MRIASTWHSDEHVPHPLHKAGLIFAFSSLKTSSSLLSTSSIEIAPNWQTSTQNSQPTQTSGSTTPMIGSDST